MIKCRVVSRANQILSSIIDQDDEDFNEKLSEVKTDG